MKVQKLRPILYIILVAALTLQCSDSGLYGKNGLDPSADRLGVTGRVCTDDPRDAGFPVRVVFIVDRADGPMFASFDPEQLRLRELNDTLSIHEGNEQFEFAVVGMGPTPLLHAPAEDGYFTRNPGELVNATALLGQPQGCIDNRCRNYEDSIFLARSLIEGDLADMNAGERNRTQYVVVLLAGGAPSLVGTTSWDNALTTLRDDVIELKKDVEVQASSLTFHTLHLAADEDQESRDNTENLLRELAFAGTGRFERFNAADAITFDRVGLLKLSALLEAKSLLVTNVNVLPNLGTPLVDSDGDGLGDEREEAIGTDPTLPDTDGDGIGDLIEFLTLLDPTTATPIPDACVDIAGPPFTDGDNDRLNECEELLLGTDPSLTDTDGDGITDGIEVVLGTDYIHADYLEDGDWDGVGNGDEAAAHTDPRSNDASSHLESGYRYEVDDAGLVREPSVAQPTRILGVEILEAGTGSTGGVATLRFSPSPPTLWWQDPQDPERGPKVVITDQGEYLLRSSSDETEERWLRVNVFPSLLPVALTEEYLLVQMVERQCFDFTVRNIRLVETQRALGVAGENDVFIYFSEAPKGDMLLPGLFRVAHIPVVYNPNTGREPSAPLVELTDADFMTVGL